MDKMLQAQGHRIIWGRPRARTLLLVALAMFTAYFILFSDSSSQLQVVPYLHDKAVEKSTGSEKSLNGDDDDEFVIDDEFKIPEKIKHNKPAWELTADEIKDWVDPTDKEDPTDVEKGYETDGKYRSTGDLSKLQREKDMRKEWRHAYHVTANLPTSDLIYGNTLSDLEHKEDRSEEHRAYLRDDPGARVGYSVEKPVRFNPYPDYNSDGWKEKGYAPYVPCMGATGEIVEDLLVFKGRPHDWPAPRFGSYSVLNMDANLCWERETRLGPYGEVEQFKKTGGESEPITWDNVNWGDLQRKCVHKNAKRYDMNRSRKNEYMNLYPETAEPVEPEKASGSSASSGNTEPEEKSTEEKLQDSNVHVDSEEAKVEETKDKRAEGPSLRRHELEDNEVQNVQNRSSSGYIAEKRTAILLRSYTGKNYTENDKQIIRSLVSELSLKSGGEYEVFLLVQVKDSSLRIFDDPETYQYVLSENIPPEFQGITVLWNDEVVWNIYTEMKDENERTVHTAQWLSVQKFSHDHPQFDFVWNWEMDFRFTGHHYELLNKLQTFAKKQPRKGMWERNERWYIPEYHGDYDSDFRKEIERRHGNDTVWGPPDLPFINPAGPKPPVSSPFFDNYEWGVGEDADVVTVGPIFNPVNSNWVIANHVWGYKDEDHKSKDIPRRTTIVTQSRISKRLLDMMHVENMRGNHVASEMTPQTVALLHGFKAVYAPHPIFMDRNWDGKFLNKWFNPGENGECGGRGSPMGWGRERRYQGSTWYYRAEPPNRLYNNWMGWSDTDIGGAIWEQKFGRPCLPQLMLHQVKDSVPTEEDHKTGFELAYG